MKPSNVLLLLLSVIFVAGLLITDRLLAIQYTKIDLGDPFKNFKSIVVQPFKALKITGGNGYAIRIKQDSNYNIRLLKSRESFFKMRTLNDTLFVTFAVANQNYQQPKDATVGMIIFLPEINYLEFSGTNNEVTSLKQDSLSIHQDVNSVTRLKDLKLDYLHLVGTGNSYFDFQLNNNTNNLNVDLKNTAIINFGQVSFNTFTPVLQDSASIIVYKESLRSLKH